MPGETVDCATVSQYLYIHDCTRCPPLRQVLSDFRDFCNGVCHVLTILIAQSHPGMGL